MFAAVAAFAAASCAQELDNQLPEGEAVVYTASVDGADTKAALDGMSTNWENGDAILLYDGTAAAKYVTSLEAPAPNADFAIADGETALAGNKVIAVYPEWADGYKSSVADIDAKTLNKAYLAPNQNAKAGSYDPNAAIAMAYSEDNHLEFKNATALLKFTVANEDVQNVTIYTIGGEKLTGEWALDYNGGEPKATPAEGDASAGWVELSAGEGVFEVGTEYYIAVYPQTLAGGFGLEFGFKDVAGKHLVKKYESSVEFKRNVILDLGNLEFTGTIEPEEPAAEWAIAGTFNGWNTTADLMTLENGFYVARNVTGLNFTAQADASNETSATGFQFINKGAWKGGEGKVTAGTWAWVWNDNGQNIYVNGATAETAYDIYLNPTPDAGGGIKFVVVAAGTAMPEDGVVEPEDPEFTPGEESGWALVGAFSSWQDKPMLYTDEADVVVLEGVEMEAAQGFLVRKPATEWADKYGAGNVNYIKADHYITTVKGGGDMCLETTGTYDIYFNISTKALYVMTASTSYTSATEQTVSGKEPVQEEPEVTANVLYLKPNSNWIKDNARFAAYFFGGTPSEVWVSMTDSDKDGIYEVNIPEGYDYGCNVIFCRMNPSTTANNWNNKWNQTADLKAPTDGKNLYTVKDGTWDKGGGTWSVK